MIDCTVFYCITSFNMQTTQMNNNVEYMQVGNRMRENKS